jgi:hypothetical protein
LPPGTEVSAKVPSLGFGKTSLMSATLPAAFLIVIITPVFGPGGGVMTPVILMGWAPEYAGMSVWSVIEYVVAAKTGMSACDERQMSASKPEVRSARCARANVSGKRVFCPRI